MGSKVAPPTNWPVIALLIVPYQKKEMGSGLQPMKFSIYYTRFFIAAAVMLLCFAACTKDYSYEGGPGTVPVLPAPPDTSSNPGVPNPALQDFDYCAACDSTDALQLSSWSFKIDTSFLCGKVDTAILNYDRDAFTFFGPSACGDSTGLIFSVYLGATALDRDFYNFTVPFASFHYYHTTTPYLNAVDESFKLTITSYIHATGIATGTFSGVGYREDGVPAAIHSGKFIIRL
jgi:hypothetical protein